MRSAVSEREAMPMLRSPLTLVAGVLLGSLLTASAQAGARRPRGTVFRQPFNNFLGYPTAGLAPFGDPFFGQVAAGETSTVNASLANGMGDEGAIKAALAATIARQATPEYMANLDRAYDRVALRASASRAL